MKDYAAFLAGKAIEAPPRGLEAMPQLAGHLFPFQAGVVEHALTVGSSLCALGTGLGKTAVQLEFCRVAMEAEGRPALILTPLAVARQIEREGRRWGYDAQVVRSRADVRPGINVCNYDRLDLLDVSVFGPVALDESSIIKEWTGKTTQKLIATFRQHRFRLCASATPAPNDHTELGTHAEFLGVMSILEMLARWFINDSADTGTWRLKGHAVDSFWDWMASWSRMAEHPRDLGDDIAGYDLPPLDVHRHRIETDEQAAPGMLFGGTEDVSATGIHALKRRTAGARADRVAELVTADSEPWLVWVDTDYEADAVLDALGKGYSGLVEVRGSHPIERKEDALAAFLDGTARVLLTKPSVAGWGLNLQHCARMVFVGRSFSYEAWHQAVRRCWRFGQKRPVQVHLIVAEGEDAIGRVIDRKSADHARMRAAMTAAMLRNMERAQRRRVDYTPTHAGRLPAWLKETS